jgi:hypothetical protein
MIAFLRLTMNPVTFLFVKKYEASLSKEKTRPMGADSLQNSLLLKEFGGLPRTLTTLDETSTSPNVARIDNNPKASSGWTWYLSIVDFGKKASEYFELLSFV